MVWVWILVPQCWAPNELNIWCVFLSLEVLRIDLWQFFLLEGFLHKDYSTPWNIMCLKKTFGSTPHPKCYTQVLLQFIIVAFIIYTAEGEYETQKNVWNILEYVSPFQLGDLQVLTMGFVDLHVFSRFFGRFSATTSGIFADSLPSIRWLIIPSRVSPNGSLGGWKFCERKQGQCLPAPFLLGLKWRSIPLTSVKLLMFCSCIGFSRYRRKRWKKLMTWEFRSPLTSSSSIVSRLPVMEQ